MLAQAEDGGKGLKRTLGAGNLIALGVGAIIGAGLFVRTAAAAGQAVNFATNGTSFKVVPEPSALLLGAVGMLGLLRRRRN